MIEKLDTACSLINLMPWLTPIVFRQGADESLTRIPRFEDGPRSIHFRHVVHAYTDNGVPDNNGVQKISFDTIRQAIQFAAPDYRVDCVAVTFADDANLIPHDVIAAPHLKRVVTEIATFAVKRPLPLLFDVLANGAAAELPVRFSQSWRQRVRYMFHVNKEDRQRRRAGEIEYFVMTNSDIHVQPGFYRVLAEFIARGYDVITTNRRTIDVDPGDRSYSPIYMADRGSDHGGFDCFVFPTSMLEKFITSDGCCGSGHVMRSLLFNLVALARRFLMLTHAQLTYHLGNDEYWGTPAFGDYMHFNIRQAVDVIARLAGNADAARRLADFIQVHEGDAYREAISTSLGLAR